MACQLSVGVLGSKFFELATRPVGLSTSRQDPDLSTLEMSQPMSSSKRGLEMFLMH